ncbi:MAG: hypothetical protein HY080_06460 [Gammaproteobacteria bacterium]|nr:hypothetical protein [Gammaproteobacteria bacterium]
MSSNEFAAPLRLELAASRLYSRYLLSIHLLGFITACTPTQFPWTINLFIMIVVAGSAARYCPVWFQTTKPTALWVWQDTLHWRETQSDITWRLMPKYFLSRWVIIVRLQSGRGQCRVVIWRDALPIEVFTALYRRLKFQRYTVQRSATGV